MPTFAYQARDKNGRRVNGTREASDQRTALEGLREAGFFVTQLAPDAASAPKSPSPNARAIWFAWAPSLPA